MAQWIKRPPAVREVMGSILVGNSDVVFVPRSCYVDQFSFHISSSSLKFTIFIAGFHMTSLNFRLQNFDPPETLLS